MFYYLHKMEIIDYDLRDFGRMHRIKNGGRLQEKRWIDHDKVTDFIAFVDDETYRLCFMIMYDTGGTGRGGLHEHKRGEAFAYRQRHQGQ
ncbi:MAG: hypothetical protein U9N12_09830 [Euryarchaeota archaeon]|nr:hypothetical protein [Euryarchaeota archaeon]